MLLFSCCCCCYCLLLATHFVHVCAPLKTNGKTAKADETVLRTMKNCTHSKHNKFDPKSKSPIILQRGRCECLRGYTEIAILKGTENHIKMGKKEVNVKHSQKPAISHGFDRTYSYLFLGVLLLSLSSLAKFAVRTGASDRACHLCFFLRLLQAFLSFFLFYFSSELSWLKFNTWANLRAHIWSHQGIGEKGYDRRISVVIIIEWALVYVRVSLLLLFIISQCRFLVSAPFLDVNVVSCCKFSE